MYLCVFWAGGCEEQDERGTVKVNKCHSSGCKQEPGVYIHTNTNFRLVAPNNRAVFAIQDAFTSVKCELLC